MMKNVNPQRRRRSSVELNRHAHAVNAGRRADIHDLGFCDRAVGHDGKIPLRRQDMRRAPVQLDDPTLRSALEPDPIIRAIGAAEIENKAGEYVAQRALEREADDDRDGPGGREQTLDGKVEDIGYDGEEGGEIDEAREDVMEQIAFPRPLFKY